MAIIKKYNKALQTLEVFDTHQIEDLSDEDDKVSLRSTQQQMDKGQKNFSLPLIIEEEELKLEEKAKVVNIDTDAA